MDPQVTQQFEGTLSEMSGFAALAHASEDTIRGRIARAGEQWRRAWLYLPMRIVADHARSTGAIEAALVEARARLGKAQGAWADLCERPRPLPGTQAATQYASEARRLEGELAAARQDIAEAEGLLASTSAELTRQAQAGIRRVLSTALAMQAQRVARDLPALYQATYTPATELLRLVGGYEALVSEAEAAAGEALSVPRFTRPAREAFMSIAGGDALPRLTQPEPQAKGRTRRADARAQGG